MSPAPASEIRSILKDVSASGRTVFRWEVSEPAPRDEVQASLLAAICLETALVAGGALVPAPAHEPETPAGGPQPPGCHSLV